MENKNTISVALVEFSPVWEDASSSLGLLENIMSGLFRDSVELSPDIVVLPEFFAVGFSMNPDVAESPENSITLEWMKKMSARYGCAITGSVPVSERRMRFNRLYFVSPDGEIFHYDKSHLFFGGENENYTPGDSKVSFEYRGWKIMPGICFDMRFPEWSRNSPSEPFDVYLNVANWPVARNAAADILLKARSIENVCWSLFCNRTGADTLLEYSGASAVSDYRGRSRGRRTDVAGTPVVYAVLEKEPMYRFRSGFPVIDSIIPE